MCGIVGLFSKSPADRARSLGDHLGAMLAQMAERGPDSAGVAIYRDPVAAGHDQALPVRRRPALRLGRAVRRAARRARLRRASRRCASATRCSSSTATRRPRRRWLREHHPELRVMSAGEAIEIYKEMGDREEFVARFALAELQGTHALGHTRMATESRVTTEHSHPFSTGLDLCLVHNGSLSNHNRLRRELRREGIQFDTDNDTEVAAGYLTWRLREGATHRGGARELPRRRSTASTPSRSARATASRCCATRSRASRRSSPRPTTGSRWPPSTARSRCFRARPTRPSGSRRPASVYSWRREAALVAVTRRRRPRSRRSISRRSSLRELNARLHELAHAPGPRHWRVAQPGRRARGRRRPRRRRRGRDRRPRRLLLRRA